MPEAEILALVKQRSEAFDRKIRRRDRRETIALIVVVVLFAADLLFFAPLSAHASWLTWSGVALVLGGGIFIYTKLRRTRTRHAGLPVDRPLTDVVHAERSKLDAQINLLENILWWYILLIALGVVLIVAAERGLSWFTLGYIAFVVVLSGGTYYLNQRAVRRELRPRREELTRLLQQVEEQ